MALPQQYRQGDILFVRVEQLPQFLRRVDHRVIAEGEATGHCHEAKGDNAVLLEDGNGLYMDVTMDTPVVHPEHKPVTLPPGFYTVVRQREYTAEAIRRVRD